MSAPAENTGALCVVFPELWLLFTKMQSVEVDLLYSAMVFAILVNICELNAFNLDGLFKLMTLTVPPTLVTVTSGSFSKDTSVEFSLRDSSGFKEACLALDKVCVAVLVVMDCMLDFGGFLGFFLFPLLTGKAMHEFRKLNLTRLVF